MVEPRYHVNPLHSLRLNIVGILCCTAAGRSRRTTNRELLCVPTIFKEGDPSILWSMKRLKVCMGRKGSPVDKIKRHGVLPRDGLQVHHVSVPLAHQRQGGGGKRQCCRRRRHHGIGIERWGVEPSSRYWMITGARWSDYDGGDQ